MLVKCQDIGWPGGITVYINPDKIDMIGTTPVDQTTPQGAFLPKGSALIWFATRNVIISAEDCERLIREVENADTKIVFTRPVEDVLKA